MKNTSFFYFSMENDNAELYGGGYDNYYENGGWYQDEYGEWYQDPAYADTLPNGTIPNGTSGNKSTLSNHNVIQSGTTSANNKSMQNKTNSLSHKDPRYISTQYYHLSVYSYITNTCTV